MHPTSADGTSEDPVPRIGNVALPVEQDSTATVPPVSMNARATSTIDQTITSHRTVNDEGNMHEQKAGSEVSVGQQSPSTSDIHKTGATDQEPGNQIEPQAVIVPLQHRIVRHGAILSLLSFAAIWGTLTRERLVALNTYPGQSVAPVIWAQAFGCLVMGWAVATINRTMIEQRYQPAYIMITTGYCGSITTFSTWVLEVFRAFSDQYHFRRGGLHNVMDALSQTFVTLGMSLFSLKAGMALADLVNIPQLESLIRRRRTKPSSDLSRNQAKARQIKVDGLVLIFGLTFWVSAIVLCATYPPFRGITFSLVLGPPGAILRWYLSRLNSNSFSQRQGLPLGTFLANLLATLILSSTFLGSRIGTNHQHQLSITSCQALKGIQDGFCATLSTISTFTVELTTLFKKKKWLAIRYFVISWCAGVFICILVLGSGWWSKGLDAQCIGVTLSN